jgi:hypothetical protein
MNENREWCKGIVERLEAIAEGRMYRCPECGEYVEDNRLFCDCGAQVDLIGDDESEPWEQVSFYDYFEGGIYDVEFRVGSDRQYRSVKIMVACGGPNIYIDTAARAVLLYWWTDRAEFPIDPDTVEAIDEWAEEWFNC